MSEQAMNGSAAIFMMFIAVPSAWVLLWAFVVAVKKWERR